MKLTFKKLANGRISVNDIKTFNALVVSDATYLKWKTLVWRSSVKTVFGLAGQNNKLLYAVIPDDEQDNTYIVVKVIAVREKGAIKLMFETMDEKYGTRMYIEDGDYLYTTFTEAMNDVNARNKNGEFEQTGSSDEDKYYQLGRKLGQAILDAANDIKEKSEKKYEEIKNNDRVKNGIDTLQDTIKNVADLLNNAFKQDVVSEDEESEDEDVAEYTKLTEELNRLKAHERQLKHDKSQIIKQLMQNKRKQEEISNKLDGMTDTGE